MDNVINGVILFFIFLFFIRAINVNKRKSKQAVRRSIKELNTDFKPNPANTMQPTGGTKTTGISEGLRGGTAGSAGEGRSNQIHYLMEDRKHDWLARQLAEERIAKKRMRDMFGFKEIHSDNCEARMIREEHQANCEAHGIDTATK